MISSSDVEEISKLKAQVSKETDRHVKTKELEASHTAETESLKAQIKSLYEEHAVATETHVNSIQSLQDQLKALDLSKAEELAALSGQLGSIKQSKSADIEAARFQAESLKHIIQSMEAEEQTKEEEHAQQVDKLESEISTGIRKLAEASSRLRTVSEQVTELELTCKAYEVELEEVRKMSELSTEREADPSSVQADGSKMSTGAKVDGQIAGIQEQLRQLDDLDRQMLEEHKTMARVLSLGVDDDHESHLRTSDGDVD